MNRQPSERIWLAMKRMATTEKGDISVKQAADRVRAIAVKEGGGSLPDRALRFYAAEYVAMVEYEHRRTKLGP